jgi:LuxR family maltose regulon positive regulatory protein
MASTLVSTKLHIPAPRPTLVPRDRLTARLDADERIALTLVSAAPGFGKTTILSTWLAGTTDRAVAWVSLDEGDSQPSMFWQYVVAALGTALPGVGAGVLPLLEAGQAATPALLTSVLNDLADAPTRITLVLDDYHLADGPEVAEGMTYVLDHRPPNLHVVVGTRADPQLPLSRLRARGELLELRARDLRFTADEAATYLTDVHGLTLGPDDVAALEARTEGWAAALQLAALSMQGRDDVGGFVAGFAGTDRFVVDYLVDEVLSRQSDDVRDFLLRTSMLDRLCGDLCDAVLETSASATVLDSLDRANLFVVPLDDERRWYRYHHLFADVLRAHVRADGTADLPALHLRASHWYADAGEPVASVRHALAAGDVDFAADVVEAATPGLRRGRQEAILRRWADDFPDDVLRRRPVLAVTFIGALMSCNEFAEVAPRLDALADQLPEIERRIASGPVAGRTLVVVDESELARIPGAIELYRAGLALVSGDLAGTHRHAAFAIQAAPARDDVVRAGAAGLSGLAHWAVGDLDSAYDRYDVCVAGLRRAQHLSDAIGCYLTLAEIRAAQGRLRDADAVYTEALALARGAGGAPARGIADVHVGVAELALERGDLAAARSHLDTGRSFGEELALPRYAGRSRAVAALLAEAEGDLVGALDLTVEAEQVYLGDFSPNVRPLHAAAARLRLRLGDLDAAERWARDRGPTAHDDLAYLRECEHVTLAELLLARHLTRGDAQALTDSRDLLQRLLDAATDGGRDATAIDVSVLQALAATDDSTARDALARAVALAEPESVIRPFTRHGIAIMPLLTALAAIPGSSPYAATLLRAVPTSADEALTTNETAQLIDPLSPRELEVLRLLTSDLDGPEIARHLFLSLNTVRTHTKSIYTKLGVTSRRAAVRRGSELGLIGG